MDNEVFPTRNKLPDLITDIVKEHSMEALTPGEETWCVPWAIQVDEDGTVSINTDMGDRDQKPGGTVELKVIRDFDGIVVDATGLSRESIERFLKPRRTGPGSGIVGDDASKYSPVIGILYPKLTDNTGLNPKDVEQFNADQRKTHKRFSDYYKRTYNRDYVFASDEMNDRNWRPSAAAATLGTVATRRSGRWGHRR